MSLVDDVWAVSFPSDPVHVQRQKKFVLLALASFADEQGQVAMSLQWLGWLTHYSRCTVRRALRALVQDGVLVAAGYRFGGRSRPVRYLIDPSKAHSMQNLRSWPSEWQGDRR